MKNKLEMAHEFMLAMIKAGCSDGPELLERAWQYADAMQAEADERKPKEPRETHKNLAEFKMHPEYDASINYPPDAWVMYKGEKRLAVSIDIEKEWQPDWSQAPSGYDWFVVGGRSGKGFFCLVEPAIVKDHYWFVGEDSLSVDKHNYQGDWRSSLRKRPQ